MELSSLGEQMMATTNSSRLGLWLVSILLGSSLLATTAGAQTWGVKGGLNLSNISFEDFETSAELGAVAGGFYRLPLFGGLRIQVEGLFAQRRVTIEETVREELNYLEVPVLARYRVVTIGGRPVHVLGGGVLGFLLAT